ncbi:hypothetical protein [Adhaeribacter rhizoryzae]|nr:hypothetical protein [Adhaeribacter rhizoryzae]
MGKFFAEVWFDQVQNHIVKVRTFKCQQCLEPYLDLVDLSDVIS